ncbi:MAG TPA: hypothetical protein VGI45_00595 [Terracidiphilus sp.]|jgi:hypothetical protein
MKLLRSITRRGFNVGTAGWFTVLKPNTWFPASRLPGSFRYRINQSAETTAADDASRNGMAISPRIIMPGMKDRRPVHFAFVVFTAIAITSAMLWWIMHP